jgi:poly-gamma-glutamate system protein
MNTEAPLRRRPISRRMLGVCAASLLFSGIALASDPMRPVDNPASLQVEREAARRTVKAFEEVKRVKLERGIPIEKDDIHGTGIIGPAFSPIVTSMGTVQAKRTSTHPAFSGIVVRMIREAGVREGEVACFGLSGSFPGLNIAALMAAETLNLNLIVISSVGSSKWGGTHPEMTWLDMEVLLHRSGMLRTRSIAASLTGGHSQHFLLPEGDDLAKEAVRKNGLSLIVETDQAAHVRRRLNLYETAANGRPIRIFVNVGGPGVNLGTDESGPEIPSGLLVKPLNDAPGKGEGIIPIMLRRGIPVINLFNVISLAKQYGLPIDSVPLPIP